LCFCCRSVSVQASRPRLLLAHAVKVTAVALELCSDTTMFLQAAMVVAHRCSSFNYPSVVPMVAKMASAARAQWAVAED
jgi:hypothetical protein